MSEKVNEGLTADLNKLFEERHELQNIMVDPKPLNEGFVWQEETGSDGVRKFVNLTLKSFQDEETMLPEPRRARGSMVINSFDDFVKALVTAKTEGKQKPIVQVYNEIAPAYDAYIAQAVLNGNTFDGKLGHGDWVIKLQNNPEPMARSWFDAVRKGEIGLDEFADLVYSSGDIVVDKEQLTADDKRLAKRLQLNLADSLGELISCCSGLGGRKTQIEEDVSIDPHTGIENITLARKGQASISIPTGIVIAWTLIPNYTTTVMLRLATRVENSTSKFRLTFVNQKTKGQHLANEIYNDILAHMDSHEVYRTA